MLCKNQALHRQMRGRRSIDGPERKTLVLINPVHADPLHMVLVNDLQNLKHQFRDAVILSTDDYFIREDGSYLFQKYLLDEAHEWNHERAKSAMRLGRSTIIIDNTNTEAWEMKPYVNMARENGYEVKFREPDTPWKFDIRKLTRINSHGVPRETIERMKERYERNITIDKVLHAEREA
ncbi:NEDD4-binding protein 2-like 1 isoform X2 [Rhincodon typus]|uniref:NEDD4-binding protein 2-like 1 isoform X2 n=1 Tax=Rhincodon typus TaxID=259920 RepID=UPI0009A33618|nr:NEDD4-binding protein 2-like 1 isoform X2 [Rhincodon typus]XP_048454194.1 NEDD4-binding protein 2-like 1 isoform X2 [Rhincodon typus]